MSRDRSGNAGLGARADSNASVETDSATAEAFGDTRAGARTIPLYNRVATGTFLTDDNVNYFSAQSV